MTLFLNRKKLSQLDWVIKKKNKITVFILKHPKIIEKQLVKYTFVFPHSHNLITKY